MLVPVALLADRDAETIEDEVARYLRRCGYRVEPLVHEEVRCGLEARSIDAVLFVPDTQHMDRAKARLVQLRDAGPQPIVVVHPPGEESRALDLLDLGATDFVCRDPAAPSPLQLRELRTRLASALRRVSRPQAPSGNTIEFADLEIQDVPMRVTRNGRLIPLTRIEFKLLRRLCRSPNEVVSFSQLLEAAWPDDRQGNVEYLRTYMARIRKALGWPAYGTQGPRIRARRGHGYVLESPED